MKPRSFSSFHQHHQHRNSIGPTPLRSRSTLPYPMPPTPTPIITLSQFHIQGNVNTTDKVNATFDTALSILTEREHTKQSVGNTNNNKNDDDDDDDYGSQRQPSTTEVNEQQLKTQMVSTLKALDTKSQRVKQLFSDKGMMNAFQLSGSFQQQPDLTNTLTSNKTDMSEKDANINSATLQGTLTSSILPPIMKSKATSNVQALKVMANRIRSVAEEMDPSTAFQVNVLGAGSSTQQYMCKSPEELTQVLSRQRTLKKHLSSMYIPKTLDKLREDPKKRAEFAQQILQRKLDAIPDRRIDYHKANLLALKNPKSALKDEIMHKHQEHTQHVEEVRRLRDFLDLQYMEAKQQSTDESRQEQQLLRNRWLTSCLLARSIQRVRRLLIMSPSRHARAAAKQGNNNCSYQYTKLRQMLVTHGNGKQYCSITDESVASNAESLAKQIIEAHAWKFLMAYHIRRKRALLSVIASVLKAWQFKGQLFNAFHAYKRKVNRCRAWWRSKLTVVNSLKQVRLLQLQKYCEKLRDLSHLDLFELTAVTQKHAASIQQNSNNNVPFGRSGKLMLLAAPTPDAADMFFRVTTGRKKTKYNPSDAEYAAAVVAAHPLYPATPDAIRKYELDSYLYMIPALQEIVSVMQTNDVIAFIPPPRVLCAVSDFILARDRALYKFDFDKLVKAHTKLTKAVLGTLKTSWKRVFLPAEVCVLVVMAYTLYVDERQRRRLSSEVPLDDEDDPSCIGPHDLQIVSEIYSEENMEFVLNQCSRGLLQRPRDGVFRKLDPSLNLRREQGFMNF